MHLYVEMWKARPAWLAMEPDERAAFLARLEPMVMKLVDEGMQLIGFAVTDADVPHGAADYPYMSVWRMPTLDLVRAYEQAVEATGWHDYFDQTNARGSVQTAAALLEHMTRAQQP
jgi:hypothetical protein